MLSQNFKLKLSPGEGQSSQQKDTKMRKRKTKTSLKKQKPERHRSSDHDVLGKDWRTRDIAHLFRLMAPYRLTQEAKKCKVLQKRKHFRGRWLWGGQKRLGTLKTFCKNDDRSPKEQSNQTYQLQPSNSGKTSYQFINQFCKSLQLRVFGR